MIRPTSELFIGGPDKIVYKRNLNLFLVNELKYYFEGNTYIKPNIKNGLLDKPYICLTTRHGYGERQ
jgi:hypothetical protein